MTDAPEKNGTGRCEELNLEHAWRDGPSLMLMPPIQTRYCANCGKVQHLSAPQWEDR